MAGLVRVFVAAAVRTHVRKEAKAVCSWHLSLVLSRRR